MKKSGYVAENDLLDAVRDGKTVLAELDEEELPEELRGLDDESRTKKLAEYRKDREALVKEIDTLSRQRQDFLRAEAEKSSGREASSFDNEVLKMLRVQAGKKGIHYEVPRSGSKESDVKKSGESKKPVKSPSKEDG